MKATPLPQTELTNMPVPQFTVQSLLLQTPSPTQDFMLSILPGEPGTVTELQTTQTLVTDGRFV